MAEAENSETLTQLLAGRALEWQVIAAPAIGLLAFVVWHRVAGQPVLFALTRSDPF